MRKGEKCLNFQQLSKQLFPSDFWQNIARRTRAPRKTVASGGNAVREAQLYECTVSIAGLGAPDSNATRSRVFDVTNIFS